MGCKMKKDLLYLYPKGYNNGDYGADNTIKICKSNA